MNSCRFGPSSTHLTDLTDFTHWSRPRVSGLAGLMAIFFIGLFTRPLEAAELVVDRAITVHSAREAAEKRRALIRYLWGAEGFPQRRLPDVVLTNVASPVKQLGHLERVDELRTDLAPGLQGLAYHFIPQHPNSELVVVHHGHACTLDDDPSPRDVGYGLQRTIAALLREGYGVLGVFMPHQRPGDCTGGHDAMFQLQTTGSPIRYFLEPTAISLNYLKRRSRADHFPKYRTFHITGLSGGGWTTTVYAAIDPTVRCSFPVAGTIPLYLRSGGSVADREQFEPSFYRLAGYPDLYVLGAHGRGLASYWRTPSILRSARGRDALGIARGERVLGLLHLGPPEREPAARERVPVEKYVEFLT